MDCVGGLTNMYTCPFGAGKTLVFRKYIDKYNELYDVNELKKSQYFDTITYVAEPPPERRWPCVNRILLCVVCSRRHSCSLCLQMARQSLPQQIEHS